MRHNLARNAPPETSRPKRPAQSAQATALRRSPTRPVRWSECSSKSAGQARPPACPRHDPPGMDVPYDAAVVVRERRRGTLTTVSSGVVVVLALAAVALAA